MKKTRMKRSEMVSAVAYSIRKYLDSGESYENVASEIIDDLEAMGMKPPIHKKCPVLHRDLFSWGEEDVSNNNS
jgi:hypothetical protein